MFAAPPDFVEPMMPVSLGRPFAGLFLAMAAILTVPAAFAEDPAIDFVHEIAPILRTHCGKCHLGDAKRGGFSMNTREAMLAGGDSGSPGFVEGNSAESEILLRISSEDDDLKMPPEGKRLTPLHVAMLRRWVEAKSPWTEGFSFKGSGYEPPLALRKVELPPVQKGRTNPIDRLVDAYWQEHGIARPPRSDDRTFIRRVSLDLVGLLPEPQRVKSFVADSDPDKRAKLVRELLDDKLAYAEHWMTFWNDLLRNDYSGTGFITGGRKQITTWLHGALVANMPYDQFVRELISPSDQSRGFIDGIVWRGEVNSSQTVPIQFAQNVGQTFLGINLKCASCHDSFVDRWTLQQTYDLAAIFSDKPLELHRCDKATGVMARPAWLFEELGQVDAAAPQKKRLTQLATIVTKPENGWLSRTLVNRLWHRLLGRGPVHPVDALRSQPWSEEVLDYLAGDLVAHSWDVKQVLELICTSEAYGAETPSVAGQPQGASYVFHGPLPRRMTAEQFTDAVWGLTDTAPLNADAKVTRGDAAFAAKDPQSNWIWSNAEANSPANERLTFRKRFDLTAPPTRAHAIFTADNDAVLFLNGKRMGENHEWGRPAKLDITAELIAGSNEMVIVAANAAAGGPAAMRAELILQNADGSYESFGTDENWQFTDHAPDDNGRFTSEAEPKNWASAVVIKEQNAWGGVAEAFANSRLSLTTGSLPRVRAVLVKGTPLMVALGRPNRDQVVTSRPTDLTTLEAIQLANEQTLSDEFTRGGTAILKQFGPQPEAILNGMFAAALARAPSAEEAAAARQILGEKPTAQEVADCLWAIVMLPEFQLIR